MKNVIDARFCLFALFVSLLSPAFVANCYAQSSPPHFYSANDKLSFSYDGAFASQPVQAATQVVHLKVASLGYPEFEINRLQGNPQSDTMSAQDFADRETSELARVGIVDVKVLQTSTYTINGRECWLTELRYPLGDKVILAAIATINGENNQSFRLIYRDIVASYFRHKPLRDQIFSSLRQGGNASPVFLPTMIAPPGAPINDSGMGNWFIPLVIFLICLLAYSLRKSIFRS